LNATPERARVLVVDDAEDLRLLISEVLIADGHAATSVASGEEALAFLRTQRPGAVDVVVLDVQMPGADGWEVLQALRAQPTIFGRPAVLLCSVKNTAADREMARLLGADDYLSKPFAIAELTGKIADLMTYAGDERQADQP
jgi:CheY-like chemotaxis protein